jgi:hypothetical protein
MTGIAETMEITEPMVITGTKEIIAIRITRTGRTEKKDYKGSGNRGNQRNRSDQAKNEGH